MAILSKSKHERFLNRLGVSLRYKPEVFRHASTEDRVDVLPQNFASGISANPLENSRGLRLRSGSPWSSRPVFLVADGQILTSLADVVAPLTRWKSRRHQVVPTLHDLDYVDLTISVFGHGREFNASTVG